MSRLISSHLVMISDLEEGARLVPLALLVLLADLADHVVGRKPGLEARGWLEEHAREGRADDAEQRDAGEQAEDAPGEAAEDVAARPQGPELGALPGALLALQALLLA